MLLMNLNAYSQYTELSDYKRSILVLIDSISKDTIIGLNINQVNFLIERHFKVDELHSVGRLNKKIINYQLKTIDNYSKSNDNLSSQLNSQTQINQHLTQLNTNKQIRIDNLESKNKFFKKSTNILLFIVFIESFYIYLKK